MQEPGRKPINPFQISQRICTLLLCLSCFNLVQADEEDAPSPSPSPTSTGSPEKEKDELPASRESLQLQLQQYAKQIEELKARRTELKRAQSRLDSGIQALQGAQDLSDLDRQMERLKQVTGDLRKVFTAPLSDAAASANPLTTRTLEIRKVVNALSYILEGHVEEVRKEYLPVDEYGEIPQGWQSYHQIFFPPQLEDEYLWLDSLPHLKEIYALTPRTSNSKEEVNLRQKFDAAKLLRMEEELNSVNREKLVALAKTAVEKRKVNLVAIQGLMKQDLDKVNDEHDTAKKHFDAVDKKLLTKEQSYQAKISEQLSPILWGSLSAIVIALVILRFKGDAVSELMIRERTAVEMISIALFLITVLFLGAGNFIEHSTLGALLGTLAGYLFTRRGSSTPAPIEPPHPVPAPVPLPPTPPAKPVYDKAAQTLTVPALPAGTTFVAAFAQPSPGGAVMSLGSATGKTVVIPPGKLTTGTSYQMWFTATNPHGESAPGAKSVEVA